jgi:hypothetical protein
MHRLTDPEVAHLSWSSADLPDCFEQIHSQSAGAPPTSTTDRTGESRPKTADRPALQERREAQASGKTR